MSVHALVPELERPSATIAVPDRTDRTFRVAAAFRGVMEALGLDLSDPNLADTPLRVARSYRELFSGLDPDHEPEMRTFPNTEGYSQWIEVSEIPFHSLCAHHFLPFFGTANVAYLPKDRLVGLSKLARAVEYHARRPQVQEALTEQIAAFLERTLEPSGLVVRLRAQHFCMEMRGVRTGRAFTTTTARRGELHENEQRKPDIDHVGCLLT